ncbi:prolyl endopeptidase FAP isoform X2 [Rhinatrema bivittatum]|uniref:prolyl endopeptidase FAP isoform X2 n=1 Tax=Rhinatrema bivittatum TaxID=194408 RepID=UPI0011295201|nr:prolyl endopeptidase FAP isoform X2 [Rhinatrema bivittatum]
MKTPQKLLLGVIAVTVISISIACIVLLAATGRTPVDNSRAFTFEDVFNNTFYYKQYFLQWISEHEYLHKSTDGNVILYNVKTGDTSIILTNKTMDDLNATNYQLSFDRKFAYLESNYKKIYVLGNNIYLKYNPMEPAIQITTNGKEDEIYNGIPDWVYEEEMLGTRYALWWSPNARFIAYVEFDDRGVPIMEYSFYGDDQYPRTIKIPYPKAGAKNPTVRLIIAKVSDPRDLSIVEVPVPSKIASSDYYFVWVTWILDERICVQWVKRIQNFSILAICDFKERTNTWLCPQNQQHIEESKSGWVGRFFISLPVFTADSRSYYKILSDKEGYKHIHYVSDSMANAKPITNGKWEAVYILTLTDDTIYYTSNEFEGYPGRRNIYKINIQKGPSSKECISCNIRKTRCQYYSAKFSKNAKYYSLYCYGPGIPVFTLHDGRNDKELRILENNTDLETKLKKIQMPRQEIKNIELNGTSFWYKMTLPMNFDKSKKYPLLIYVYAGPSSQEVQPTFSIDWKTYLASSEEIIVASLDGRGTSYQGDKILHAVNRRLGTYEVQDQISAVKKFIEMGFIDEKRIAIWGWSYGGYVASLALASGSRLFKCGMAVAPVANWEYYASIYTERYMGLPTQSDNLDHYKNSTVMARAENFKNVDYLLIHGTADDNVHFQQSAQISNALVNAHVDFQAMWYTDKDHSISGNARTHLYTHMTHFLKQCFSISS